MPKGTFETAYNTVNDAINRREFKTAAQQAKQLVLDYPDRARAYFIYHLAICLSGIEGGVSGKLSQRTLEQMWDCQDCTSELLGDAYRDQAIAYIAANRLHEARGRISSPRNLHKSDPNRLACLGGAEARLLLAEGRVSLAVELHEEADTRWCAMGSKADRQWIYNNLIHWLRAVVAYEGPSSDAAANLMQRIERQVPPGAKSRIDEARAILAGRPL